MSANTVTDPANKSAAKKKRKNKKKGSGKGDHKEHAGEANGLNNGAGGESEDDENDDESNESPEKATKLAQSQNNTAPPTPVLEEKEIPNGSGAGQTTTSDTVDTSRKHGRESRDDVITEPGPHLQELQEERDRLRSEVTQLRESLESLKSKHEDELANSKEELEQSQQGKDQAETQYRNLLGKVNTIRSQLGERLKADAAELEQARARIEDLESEQAAKLDENTQLKATVAEINTKLDLQTSEIDNLRSRSTLSTSNWVRERDDLVSKEAYLREEYEVARQAMQDWEILATEERSRREALEERITDLEEQLAASKEAHERIQGETETQSSTVDGLQRALNELQEERKRELREMVEQSQSRLDELRTQATAAELSSTEFKQQLETAQKELQRALPFEKEVKEKNLLIGKLRHEAVILNDHLTKALRFLKRGKPEDNVDRHLVTNHFLHFLALDRSDPKKFQVLQLIAALLGWTEEQKEQAGLVRQGSGSLRLPLSPFRRTPSTPSLTSDFLPESPSQGKESLAELWSDFLERESASGGTSRRRGSIMSNVSARPSMASPGLYSPGLTSPLGGSIPPVPPINPEYKRSESPSSKSTK